MSGPEIIVAVLAHNEERRIGRCLASLPLDDPGVAVHVIVNGSSDRTAAIARELGGARVTVHDWEQGGKSRSWNRFMMDTPGIEAGAYVFVDGDAELLAGSVRALAAKIAADPATNGAAGLPQNGRKAAAYQASIVADHGIFGDLYALSGSFITRMRQSAIRLPEDLIGDDGLLGALAKTDLGSDRDWRKERLQPCPAAGFFCEPTNLLSPASLHLQYKRMINYSVRHFQDVIISSIMQGEGAKALPRQLATLYPEWLARFTPRRHPVWWWFDRKALARMRAACAP